MSFPGPTFRNQNCRFMDAACKYFARVFFNTFLNICGFYLMQFGDMSLTRMNPWISLVYHLENVSLMFVSLWRFAVEKISLLITVCLFQSIGFLPLLDD